MRTNDRDRSDVVGRVARRGLSAIGYRLLFFAVFALSWWSVSHLVGQGLLPGPTETAIAALAILRDGSFVHHMANTLRRVVVPFGLALVVGLGLGAGMGFSPRFERSMDAGLVIGLTIPGLAWAIISIMLFGLGPLTAYFAVFVTILPLFAINFWQGVKALDRDLLEMGAAFDLSNYRLARDVILPQLYPYAFSAGRYGFGVSWKVVVIVEFLGFGDGIGYQLGVAYNLFDMADVLAWIGLFTLVMLAIEYGGFKALERRYLSWRPNGEFRQPGTTRR